MEEKKGLIKNIIDALKDPKKRAVVKLILSAVFLMFVVIFIRANNHNLSSNILDEEVNGLTSARESYQYEIFIKHISEYDVIEERYIVQTDLTNYYIFIDGRPNSYLYTDQQYYIQINNEWVVLEKIPMAIDVIMYCETNLVDYINQLENLGYFDYQTEADDQTIKKVYRQSITSYQQLFLTDVQYQSADYISVNAYITDQLVKVEFDLTSYFQLIEGSDLYKITITYQD